MNPTILCLHGALASASSFKKIKDAAAQVLDIQTFEFAGHGQNHNNIELSTEGFAQEVLEWMNKSGQEKVSIFGHSMGGYVGLYLAAHYPQHVERIFTFGTKMDWTPEFAASESAMLQSSHIKSNNPKLQSYLEATHQNWEQLSNAVAAYMYKLGSAPDLNSEILQKIQCPVRFGLGDRDHMVTAEETIKSYRQVTNGQLQIFPNTFHAVERLNPKYFLEAMFDFIS